MNYSDIQGGRILLLQGPIGPYFKRLEAELYQNGAQQVIKVNFNGGDRHFFPGGVDYMGRMEDRIEWLSTLIEHERIDLVVLFGDCRPVHHGVADLVRERGLQLRVFEEGYFRPAFITCETGGTNGHSTIPSDPEFYRQLPPQPIPPSRAPSRWTYWAMVVWAMRYYLLAALGRAQFPHYRHHRPLTVLAEAGAWMRGAARKWIYRARERHLEATLTGPLSGRFYLVPLQVHNDAQVTRHSDYCDVAEFIREVIGSFALHAPKTTVLVLKHHPMDRAYRDYTVLIGRLAHLYGLSQRVLYIHDQHLPTLLEHARGAVVINSTVGLSAIHQGVPTKVMGRAFYDFSGLTFAGSLSRFWFQASESRPDRMLYQQFRRWIIRTTQINDNFYAPMGNATLDDSYVPAAAPEESMNVEKDVLEQQY